MVTWVGPPLGYCESRCYEHGCANLSLSLFSLLLGIYREAEFLDHMVVLFLIFENCHSVFYSGCIHCLIFVLPPYKLICRTFSSVFKALEK